MRGKTGLLKSVFWPGVVALTVVGVPLLVLVASACARATPTPTFTLTPTQTPAATPEPTLTQACSKPVCPTLLWMDPDMAYPGWEVNVQAAGGDREFPESYSWDFPKFEMFLDDMPVGTLTCSSIECNDFFQVPEDISIGTHLVSVEGGSTIELEVRQPGLSKIPPPHWQKVEIPAKAYFPGFSLHIPPGWKFHELLSYDPNVGEIAGDGVRLFFDYGAGGPLVYRDDPEYGEHIVIWEPVGAHQAELIRPEEGKEGTTGVFFPQIDGPSLTLYTFERLTSKQQETVFAIFRTIRSMGEQLRLNITFEPEGPLLNWGTPAPYITVDRVEGDERHLAIRRDVKTESVKGGGTRPLQTSQYDRWLTPGTYAVDIDHLGDYTSEDILLTVILEPGRGVEVDIHIHDGSH